MVVQGAEGKLVTVSALKFVIRADASVDIGTGHVMRCLTLATALRQMGGEVRFVCREHEGHLCALLEDRGFAVHRLQRRVGWNAEDGGLAHAAWVGADWREDADETISALGHFSPDWMVVDHYGIDARWHRAVRSSAKRLMVIDDLADRTLDCDVLLDQNLFQSNERYLAKVPPRCTLLEGPQYALLKPEYAELRRRASPRGGPVRRVLISFGGVDKDELAAKTVEALLTLDQTELEADIVIPASSAQFERVRNRVGDRSNLRLHDRVPSLAQMMLAADIAVGACGATNWERLCLGLPALVVTVADNQREIAAELSRRGLIRWLGDAETVSQADIRAALDEIVREGLNPSWSEACMTVVDGRGVDRVTAILSTGPETDLVFRHAELTDEFLLLQWANDRVTRGNAFNPNPILPEDHRNWFRARLRTPQTCALYIAETAAGVPVGQVRFDHRGSEWEISYAVAPEFRGRGIGRSMLSAAIAYWRRSHPHAALVGQVKADNIASRRIFETLGFSVRTSDNARFVFERQVQQ